MTPTIAALGSSIINTTIDQESDMEGVTKDFLNEVARCAKETGMDVAKAVSEAAVETIRAAYSISEDMGDKVKRYIVPMTFTFLREA